MLILRYFHTNLIQTGLMPGSCCHPFAQADTEPAGAALQRGCSADRITRAVPPRPAPGNLPGGKHQPEGLGRMSLCFMEVAQLVVNPPAYPGVTPGDSGDLPSFHCYLVPGGKILQRKK